MDHLPPLSALRAFDAVMRLGRLVQAATDLGITESAVSHQIRKLEDLVGRPLFDRTKAGLQPRPEAERFHDTVARALKDLSEATRTLKGLGPGGTVSLSLPPSLAMLWLIPRLADFEASCPGLSLTLVTTQRLVDLKREQVDLALRYGHGRWPGVTAELWMSEFASPVASPAYLETLVPGALGSAKPGTFRLTDARLITSSYYVGEWEEWAAARGEALPPPARILRFDSYEQALEAASQGLGLVMGRSPMVDAHLSDGTLSLATPERQTEKAGFYLCEADTGDLGAAAKRVRRWLLAQARPTTDQSAISE